VCGVDYLKVNSFDHVVNNPMQRLQLFSRRHISGCYRSVHRFTLLKELEAVPFQVQYARLCAHYWNKAQFDKGIACHHLRANVLLFLGGSQVCWVAKILECMNPFCTDLSFNAAGSLDVDTILDFNLTSSLNFHVGWVTDSLLEKYENMFQCEGVNPHTAPSRHAHMVKYIIWFN
jgi:hypothetical protein